MFARVSGYVLVRKIGGLRGIEKGGRRNALGLGPGDIETRYIGLECAPWPDEWAPPLLGDFPGPAPESYRGLLQHRYETLSHDSGLRLLYVVGCGSSGGRRAIESPHGFEFCGYDYGWINSWSSHYSVVLNEVLYGLYGRLASFADHLNERLLLPSLDTIGFMSKARNELLLEKADLETSEECYPVQIHQFCDK